MWGIHNDYQIVSVDKKVTDKDLSPRGSGHLQLLIVLS